MLTNTNFTEISISNKNIQQRLLTNIISTLVKVTPQKIFTHKEKNKLLLLRRRPTGTEACSVDTYDYDKALTQSTSLTQCTRN